MVKKKLNLGEKERRLTVAGREVVLSPQLPDANIADSEWLVMNTRGFESESDAANFASKLKAACELSSVIARLGINAGVDKPTSGFGKLVRDDLQEKQGVVLRDNVHGIDVFPDDPNIRIGIFSATGTVRSAPDPFLTDIDKLYQVIDGVSQRVRDIVLLMNYALTRTDPVAMVVFAVSAVEMLGQDETWSQAQAQLLSQLADTAENSNTCTAQERGEVVTAIRRGIHKLSLRQGVLRLLTSLELSHLKKDWDRLYSERSTLVHGLAPKPGVDYGDLAFRAMSLCGRILLTAVAREVAGADEHLDKFYPVN
ncbi:MAG TPA: hypothetical protein VFX20_06590 [Steroidobacteraceae bacterium]|nr:hypothetical protein [Steroidobacteraceae bacterium]